VSLTSNAIRRAIVLKMVAQVGLVGAHVLPPLPPACRLAWRDPGRGIDAHAAEEAPTDLLSFCLRLNMRPKVDMGNRVVRLSLAEVS
jgi:hypothetical protein